MKYQKKFKMTTSNVLFCPQAKDIQLTVIEEWRKQKIFTLNEEKSDNFHFKDLLKLINELPK